ncbi:MAG TPA: PIN domain-containing protein [Gaiellaceae bacterium]|nr:PIN domain-containing protein [Gaiellaceae bacterium]
MLDAYPLVALIGDEPAADEVAELLRLGDVRIPVVNLCEAIDVCRRTHGVAERELRDVIDPLLLTGSLTAVTAGAPEAWRAADLRARYYDRKARALSLADCLLLAHAQIGGDEIASADPALAEVARAEGVGLVPLPGSTGVRP